MAYKNVTLRRAEQTNNTYYRFAQWLHNQLMIRHMAPRQFCDILGGPDDVPMHRIWRWLRGEGVPHLWEFIRIIQVFQVIPEPQIAKAVDAQNRTIKHVPQTWFPGMGPRKGVRP